MESIFISSTFRDMHMERDVLNLNVLPKLNSRLADYGMSIQFSDLRWGIDTTGLSSKDSMKKILNVCEHEIERCKPYIIVLLGDRYGTAISPEMVGVSEDASFIGKSITHIEVLKGVFQNYSRDRIFIYFRNIDYSTMPKENTELYKDSNDSDIKKLIELKSKLREEYGDRIKEYQSEWNENTSGLVSADFEEIVYCDIWNHLENSIKKEYSSDYLKLKYINENIVSQNCLNVYSDEIKVYNICNVVKETNDVIIFGGETGSGKTVLLSLVYKALEENSIWYYFGANKKSTEVDFFVEYILKEVNSLLGNDIQEENIYQYSSLIEQLASLKEDISDTIFIFLDSINNNDNVNRLSSFIRWVSVYFDNKIKFIIASDDSEFIDLYIGSNIQIITADYDEEEEKRIIKSILEKNKKGLNDNLITLISQQYNNPLDIQLIISRITNLKASDYSLIDKLGGGIVGINNYLEKLIVESSVNDSSLLLQIIEDIFDKYEVEQIRRILGYLAISDRGLRECDLRRIFIISGHNWNDLTYADMHMKLPYAFMRNADGIVNFSHYTFKEAFFPDDVNSYIQNLVELYYESDEGDYWAEEEFYKFIALSKNHEKFIRFVLDRTTWNDKETPKLKSRKIAANSIEKMIQREMGQFLFESIQSCKNINERILYA